MHRNLKYIMSTFVCLEGYGGTGQYRTAQVDAVK